MVISNSKQFVFVHIPKTGGTSMTHALQEIIQWNDIVCGGTSYGRQLKNVWGQRWGVGKHSPASEIRSLVGNEVWRDYFTFTVVRHPIRRALSMYRWTEREIEKQGWRRWARFFSSRFRNEVWEWPTVVAYLETNSFSEYIRHSGFLDDQIGTPQYTHISDESVGGYSRPVALS